MKLIRTIVILFVSLLLLSCLSSKNGPTRMVIFFTSSDTNQCSEICNLAEKDMRSYEERTSGVNVKVIDIARSPEVITNYNIHGLPLVITFIDGVETGRFYGYVKDTDELNAKLIKMLKLQ